MQKCSVTESQTKDESQNYIKFGLLQCYVSKFNPLFLVLHLIFISEEYLKYKV